MGTGGGSTIGRAGVSKWEQAQVQSETGSRQKAGTDRRSGSRRGKREQEQAETGKCRQAPFYAEHTTRRAGQTASPPLTPGSQVEKSIGFPYVGEETR